MYSQKKASLTIWPGKSMVVNHPLRRGTLFLGRVAWEVPLDSHGVKNRPTWLSLVQQSHLDDLRFDTFDRFRVGEKHPRSQPTAGGPQNGAYLTDCRNQNNF